MTSVGRSAMIADMERHLIETEGPRWPAIPAELGDEAGSAALGRRRVKSWALVLRARHIPYRTEPLGNDWQLMVPPGQMARALEELRRFEQENRNWPPPLPAERPRRENTMATLCVLLLLATFHNCTQLDIELLGHHPVDWTGLGNADAVRILGGQLWRLVTALTLHSDWLHLFGNLAIGGVFIVRLCRDLGSGLAWSLLLGSGILGNLINALVQQDHRSVGASTAVFGAVGILAAVSLLHHRHRLQRRWPLPIAAALALLALLGTGGEHTDLLAHLFGFGSGFALGLAAEMLLRRYGRPSSIGNAALALASAVLVLASWGAALTLGG